MINEGIESVAAMYQLDDSPLGYIYKKMAEHIELRIKSGDLKLNKPLPAEKRLAEEYDVSLGTARRATDLLRERNLVATFPSKGTFVINAGQDESVADQAQPPFVVA